MHIYHESDVKTAVLECVLDRYHSVPAEEEIVHAFSKKFEEWAQKLIRRIADKQGAFSARFSGRGLKIAIIIAALIALLATTVMAVPAIRETIIEFFFHDRGESYGVTFDPEQAATAPNAIETYWTPSTVPDGFVNIIDDKSAAGVMVWWINEKDERILYNQFPVSKDVTDDNWFGTNAEGVIHTSMVINGYKVEKIQDDEIYTVFWTDNAYFYWIEFSNTIDFSVFESMLASMTPVEE